MSTNFSSKTNIYSEMQKPDLH